MNPLKANKCDLRIIVPYCDSVSLYTNKSLQSLDHNID